MFKRVKHLTPLYVLKENISLTDNCFFKSHWHQISAFSADLQLSKIEKKHQFCTAMPLKYIY